MFKSEIVEQDDDTYDTYKRQQETRQPAERLQYFEKTLQRCSTNVYRK